MASVLFNKTAQLYTQAGWLNFLKFNIQKSTKYFLHVTVSSATRINLLHTVHGYRSSRSTSSKCNVYSLIANFLTMKMCHSLACFFHTWHAHKTNTCVVWQHLHPDVEYLATITSQQSETEALIESRGL